MRDEKCTRKALLAGINEWMNVIHKLDFVRCPGCPAQPAKRWPFSALLAGINEWLNVILTLSGVLGVHLSRASAGLSAGALPLQADCEGELWLE